MKTIVTLICIILGLTPFTSFSQESKRAKSISDSIVHYYNAENYHALHGLLSPDFAVKFPEDQVRAFFKGMVRKTFGTILNATYLSGESVDLVYELKMERGNLNMELALDGNDKISMMKWVPSKNQNPPANATANIADDNPEISSIDQLVQKVMKEYMAVGHVKNISLGVYKNGQTFFYNYSDSSLGKKRLPDSTSIYEIGSITKTFTGMLLAKAVIDKKASLNDDIRKYLPEKLKNLEYNGSPIRLVHLANHTSRIPRMPSDLESQKDYNPLDPYKAYDRDKVVRYLKTITPDTVPGFKSEYSNLGMAVLGIILERIYKKSLEQLYKETICDPFGMKQTRINVAAADSSRMISGYNNEGVRTPYWHLNGFEAAGALHSSTSDMMRYLRANMTSTTEYIKLSHQQTWGSAASGIGLGWHLLLTKNKKQLVWHNGGTYGFSSFAGFLPSEDIAIVILSGSGSSVDFIGINLLKRLQE